MKLQGPMFSLGASGSIAGTVTFATWKGRPYARQLVIPSNPKSAQQTAFRAMFRFLSQAWAGLSDGEKSSWADLAAAGNYSPFNAFMKYNQDLWGRFLNPVVDPTDTQSTGMNTVDVTATAGVRSVSINLDPSTPAVNWGYYLFRKIGSAPTGILSEVIAVIPSGADETDYTDLGLTPGLVYYYKAQSFLEDGTLNVLSDPANATPT